MQDPESRMMADWIDLRATPCLKRCSNRARASLGRCHVSTRKLGTLLTLAVLACWLGIPSFADSKARIVRLSQVDGDVQIDRNTGQGYEKAFLNLPITQGNKLRTGIDSRAEIEFEDGTTLRITPGTVVAFPELGRRDSGSRTSSLNLLEGTAYVNFRGEKADEFTFAFGREKLALTKPAHLRLELKDAEATLAVFKGDVEVEGASGKVDVEKKHSATFDLAGAEHYTLANNLEPQPEDGWDKQQDNYHTQYNALASNSYSPYSYGASDLNYYGSFYNLPGYGMMWQPYLIGAGWDPFMNGAWMWYPGAGYTWVSAYPWGWMPYRYGSWTYIPAYGWFWQPGLFGAGWTNVPLITNAPKTFNVPKPPATPGQTLLVNRGTLASPAGIVQSRVQLRGDSAGLGVPRGSVQNLGRISRQIERSALPSGTSRSAFGGTAARLPEASRVSSPRGAPTSGAPTARTGAPSSHSSAPSSHGSSH